MIVVGVIPARFGSTRFPGKPLAPVNGKPLLQWVIEGSRGSRRISKLVVATDDDRIASLARSCGVEAVMTDADLPTGTDRVYQAVRGLAADVVINIQGDEPLIRGELLDRLAEPFAADPDLAMATLGKPLTLEALSANTTAKIIVNHRDEALYFSRFPIPYSRLKPEGDADHSPDLDGALKHIGIYAYRKDFLERFCRQAPVAIEKAESLEQLRALYLGARIKVVRVDHESWGVDTPEDVQKIENIMRRGER
ncbi:MAG: 3-deoxy-manno-octulosonate cytidylyltransferase [Bdellovibrionaceae bacterium]|nr:3-deoxy-manno-octulosonate cytidylyltransferase [Pseudobdellovibrionaceae bacterium]